MSTTTTSPAATSAACNKKLVKWKGPAIKKVSISHPIIMPLKMAGIANESNGKSFNLTFLNNHIQVAANTVAMVPNIISNGKPAPIEVILAITVPSVNPHTESSDKEVLPQNSIFSRNKCVKINT